MAKINTLEDAKIELEKLCDKIGWSHTHNCVSMVLRIVAEKFGKEVANDLVDEYDLDDLFGIGRA